MPKMKTRSAAKKRFSKVSKGSKIKRSKASRRHLLTKKGPKRRRQLRKGTYVSKGDMAHIAPMLPY